MMLVLTIIIIARVAYLQILEHQYFTTLATDNRLKLVAIAPTRGLIYSRDGTILAENRPSYALEIIADKVKNLEQAIGEISELLHFDEQTRQEIIAEVRTRRGFDPVAIKTGLNEDEVALFSVNQHRFSGFRIAAHLTRHYPLGDLMAHVVGYVARVNEEEAQAVDQANYRGTTHIGKIGVEKAREDLLHGDVGFQRVEVNAQGRVVRVVEKTPPLPGANIYLTVDVELQRAATDALGEELGAVVAIDPNNGEILAFVSNPSFDPNLFVDGISQTNYSLLRDDKARPLFNRALQAQYPPGSTIKPMVALAGLANGTRISSQATWCPGFFQLEGDDHRYRDWKKQGHGHIDLNNSIAQSCDVYYYALAKDLGIDGLWSMLDQFGLGQATGIDLPGETNGLLPSREWKRRARSLPWYPGETLITGIGQGFMLTSPLQLAHAAAIIASRGQRFVPHVVSQVEDRTTLSASSIEVHERPRVKVTNDEYWQAIIDGMVSVVHGPRGTARKVGHKANYQFAGKTGTAQLFGIAQGESVKSDEVPKHLRDHALFVAFGPVEQPQLALGIIVENGGSGSAAAAPIARQIFDRHLTESEPGKAANGQ